MAKPSSGLDPLSWTPEELGRKESTKAGQVQRLLKNYFGAIWTQDRFADDFYERNDESLRRHLLILLLRQTDRPRSFSTDSAKNGPRDEARKPGGSRTASSSGFPVSPLGFAGH